MKYTAFATTLTRGTDLPSYFAGLRSSMHTWSALKWDAQEYRKGLTDDDEYHEVAVYWREPGKQMSPPFSEPDYFTFAEIEGMLL